MVKRCHARGALRRGVRLPYVGLEPVGGQATESVTRGQCVTRPTTVTFAASESHHRLTGTKLYCLRPLHNAGKAGLKPTTYKLQV